METIIWWYASETIQGPTPGGKGMHYGAIADVMSWGEVFLFERSNKNQWSALCGVCAPSVVTHSMLDWVDKIQSKAIAFSSSNGPCWPPVSFACDSGRDIVRRRDGIGGQGRWTLGKAKVTKELGSGVKGLINVYGGGIYPHTSVFSQVSSFLIPVLKEEDTLLFFCQKCIIGFTGTTAKTQVLFHLQSPQLLYILFPLDNLNV